ncbi:MAG: FAD-dependent oxidoreductase, partial [Sneathiella sp.]
MSDNKDKGGGKKIIEEKVDGDFPSDQDEIVSMSSDDNDLNIDDDDNNQSGNTIVSKSAGDGWRDCFPGPADRSFDYRKLLENSPNGIGDAGKRTDLKVAIIGAGPAGLTAAHELARSGVKNIHLFEASDRYGGRMWTRTLAPDNGEKQYSVMDAGAMRMPPFIADKGKKTFERRSEDRQKQIWAGRSL